MPQIHRTIGLCITLALLALVYLPGCGEARPADTKKTYTSRDRAFQIGFGKESIVSEDPDHLPDASSLKARRRIVLGWAEEEIEDASSEVLIAWVEDDGDEFTGDPGAGPSKYEIPHVIVYSVEGEHEWLHQDQINVTSIPLEVSEFLYEQHTDDGFSVFSGIIILEDRTLVFAGNYFDPDDNELMENVIDSIRVPESENKGMQKRIQMSVGAGFGDGMLRPWRMFKSIFTDSISRRHFLEKTSPGYIIMYQGMFIIVLMILSWFFRGGKYPPGELFLALLIGAAIGEFLSIQGASVGLGVVAGAIVTVVSAVWMLIRKHIQSNSSQISEKGDATAKPA